MKLQFKKYGNLGELYLQIDFNTQLEIGYGVFKKRYTGNSWLFLLNSTLKALPDVLDLHLNPKLRFLDQKIVISYSTFGKDYYLSCQKNISLDRTPRDFLETMLDYIVSVSEGSNV